MTVAVPSITTDDAASGLPSFVIVNQVDEHDAGIYADEFYANNMSPMRSALRRKLLLLVRQETEGLADLQKRWRTPFLDSYFTFTAYLGHPLFFVMILPILFWYGHSVFARGMVNIACGGVVATSWIKDYLSLPRPLSPPVVRLSRSKKVHLEYGLPSTHTTNSVSIALYIFSYLLISDLSLLTKLAVIVGLGIYLFSVIFGRLYCGMHNRLDVYAGVAIGTIMWAIQWGFHGQIDNLMTHPSYSVIVGIIVGGILIIKSIPETMDSCPCIDDGVTTMAVLMGIFPASQHFAASKYAVTTVDHMGIVSFDANIGLFRSVARFVVGLGVIFVWRMAAKKLLYIILPPLYRHFNFGARVHFEPAKEYKSLSNYPIGRVPSVLDLPSLSDPSIEIIGAQSTMDVHEKFSLKRSSLAVAAAANSGSTLSSRFAKKNGNNNSPAGDSKQQVVTHEKMMQLMDDDDDDYDDNDVEDHHQDQERKEREAMAELGDQNPAGAHFDVDIVIKTIVYAGIGWLAVDTIPILFEYIGLARP